MSIEPESEVVESKLCPRCNSRLPLAEFGVSRARKDGRNIYCKRCNRERTNASRQAARERRTRHSDTRHTLIASSRIRLCEEGAQGASVALVRGAVGRPMSCLSPTERIKEAIKAGPKTQKEILEDTKLSKDEIGEALADLLLWTHEIGTKTVGDTRLYFLKHGHGNVNGEHSDAAFADEVAFDANEISSFSAVCFLLPEKQSARSQPKVSLWTAA
jgi:hypothetical protein